MGDITPSQPRAPAELPHSNGVPSTTTQPLPPLGDGGNSSATSQASRPQQNQQQSNEASYHGMPPPYEMAQAHGSHRTGPFAMGALANALPASLVPPSNYGSPPYGRGQQQRYHQIPVGGPNIATQLPPAPYGAQNPMTMMANQGYYMPQQGQMGHGHYYHVAGQQLPPGTQYYYPQPTHFMTQPPPTQPQLVSSHYMPPVPQQADPRLLSPQQTPQEVNDGIAVQQSGKVPTEVDLNIVRGPPRKPKQSGFAIWIGNLPPQTGLLNLVHHVCKEADGLESLFLISKSNCAFANFKDEAACVAALKKLHDSTFQGVRLVCRLRKVTVEGAAGVTAPTGPAASAPPAGPTAESDNAVTEEAGDENMVGAAAEEVKTPTSATVQKDRYFILKSLTLEDLILSVGSGIWATQRHNEEVLNNAFMTSENVYLIFSANKSGEYFGYARMTSGINHDPAAAIQFAPAAPAWSKSALPKAIPTEATEYTPKGRIVDDSARGTIFWEVEAEDGQEQATEGGAGPDGSNVASGDEDSSGLDSNKAWGKPFRLEWLSTQRLPFYRTRGLRNPWNSNREVKIARDGTELQPAVGRKLIALFGKGPSPLQASAPAQYLPGGLPVPVAPLVGMPPAGSSPAYPSL